MLIGKPPKPAVLCLALFWAVLVCGGAFADLTVTIVKPTSDDNWLCDAHRDYDFEAVACLDGEEVEHEDAEWHWDFGDTCTSDENPVVHFFNQVGEYDVVVTATVGGRTAQDTLHIVAAQGQGPQAPLDEPNDEFDVWWNPNGTPVLSPAPSALTVEAGQWFFYTVSFVDPDKAYNKNRATGLVSVFTVFGSPGEVTVDAATPGPAGPLQCQPSMGPTPLVVQSSEGNDTGAAYVYTVSGYARMPDIPWQEMIVVDNVHISDSAHWAQDPPPEAPRAARITVRITPSVGTLHGKLLNAEGDPQRDYVMCFAAKGIAIPERGFPTGDDGTFVGTIVGPGQWDLWPQDHHELVRTVTVTKGNDADAGTFELP